MGDIVGRLTSAALRYGLELLRSVGTEDALRDMVDGVVPGEPGLTTLRDLLAAATRHVDDAEALVSADPPDLSGAAGQLWEAVGTLRAAAVLLGVPDPGPSIAALVGEQAPGGLVAALGLPEPSVVLSATALQLTWQRENPASPIPALQLGAVLLTAELTTDGLSLRFRARGVQVHVGAADDAVLQLLVGGANDLRADLDLTLDDTGVTTRGTAGPVSVPAHADLGAVRLAGLDLALVPTADGLDLRLRSRLEGTVGVIDAVVDGLGVRLSMNVPSLLDGDEFAALTPDLEVRGIGLSLDAGAVKGGGFLTRSERDGVTQYGGALALRLGPVDAKAFGLFLDLDGTPAFVAVLSAEFVPAIELGLGFTLNGIGGLLGHDVTVDTGAIAAGLKDGVLSHVLFPPDPVAAAPSILDTLARFFPPMPGGFVIGPLLSLGWGRPVSFVRLDVAVALALPDPLVVVLGRARAAFPVPDAAVIDIRASMLAQLGGGRLLVLAQLEESRVGFASVQGGFGMLARFDDAPMFAITAGGFHPRFAHAPPELTGVARISAELAPPVGLQLRISGYVALTPNTLQLGGSVEIAYSVAVAAVRGRLALDALIQLEPFGFMVDLGVRVDVEAFGKSLVGVDLALALSGPTPWRARGAGRVRLPWPLPDPSIDVGPFTWGEDAADPQPTSVRPLQTAVAALQRADAWARRDRAGQVPPVMLAQVEEPVTGALLEPWSMVSGSQRSVPLGMQVERIGRSPADPQPCTVTVADVDVGGKAGATWSPVTEAFATGEYVDLADDAALTAPDFEDRDSGVLVDPAGVTATPLNRAVRASLRYEDSFIAESFPPPLDRTAMWALLLTDLDLAMHLTAPALSGLRRVDRYAATARPLEVQPASAVRVADPATFATVVDVGHWTDASVAASSAGLSLLSLMKTGV